MMEVATFDGERKIATLTIGGEVSVRDLYSAGLRWVDANPHYLPPFDAAGGDLVDPSSGIYSAIYVKCVSGWRVVAPYSVSIVDGILMVDGGGVSPFVPAPGTIQVEYKTPLEAIAFATGGGSGGSGPSASEIASAVLGAPAAQYNGPGTIGRLLNLMLTLPKYLAYRK